MNGTKTKRAKRRVYERRDGTRMVQHHWRIPLELHSFLSTYAQAQGLSSEMQAASHIIHAAMTRGTPPATSSA